MRSLRILHIIPSVGPRRGGPSIVLRTVAEGLAELGVETHVATTNDNATELLDVPLDRPSHENGVTYHYFRRTTATYTLSTALMPWLVKHVRDYDVVHVHALFSWCPTVGSYVASAHHVPYVIRPLGVLNRYGRQFRRPLLKTLSYKCCEKRMLESAAAIHYTSEQERNEAEELGFKSRATWVVPNPVVPVTISPEDRRLFTLRYPAVAGKRVLLFLSRLDPKKGLDLLIPAFAEVRRKYPDTVLVIAGSGSDEFTQAMTQLAAAHHAQDHIIWAGFTDGHAKTAAFAGADVFVLPSYSENFGVAVIEAMTAGLPCVVSDQVAVATHVLQARAGIVTECSVKSVADALCRILADPGQLRGLSQAASAYAREAFSRHAVCTTLQELYYTVQQSESNSRNFADTFSRQKANH